MTIRGSLLLRSRSLFGMLCLSLSLSLGACSTTPKPMLFAVDASTAPVWPNEPEKPRYRYVGTLIGEQNLNREGEGAFSRFIRWVVGLGQDDGAPKMELQRPNSGTVDDEGRVLVGDVSRHSIMVFDVKRGDLFEWAVAAADIAFQTPVGIALGPNKTYFVADADLKMVVKLDHDGKPMANFGSDVLKRPTGLARDPRSGRLYVADTKAHNIKVFDDNGFLEDIIGTRGTEMGQFNAPTHLWFHKGKLYVTDTFNTRIQILDIGNDKMQGFGQRGRYLGDLVRPKGITVDSDDNIYVVESYHDYLLVYDKSGRYLLPLGGTGKEVGQFYLPSGVWVDKNDKIYVADMFNGRVEVFQYLGGKGASTEQHQGTEQKGTEQSNGTSESSDMKK